MRGREGRVPALLVGVVKDVNGAEFLEARPEQGREGVIAGDEPPFHIHHAGPPCEVSPNPEGSAGCLSFGEDGVAVAEKRNPRPSGAFSLKTGEHMVPRPLRAGDALHLGAQGAVSLGEVSRDGVCSSRGKCG